MDRMYASLVLVASLSAVSQAQEFHANDLLVSCGGSAQIVTLTLGAPPMPLTLGASSIAAQEPGPLAFGPEGWLYTVVHGSVQAFDRAGATMLQIDVAAAPLTGLAFGRGGDLYVLSGADGSISRIRTAAGQSTVDVTFAVPGYECRGLAMSAGGTLYVGARGKLIEMDTSGVVLREIPFPDPDDLPGGLAFGPAGHLYVAMLRVTTWDGGVFENRIYEYADAIHINTLGDNSGVERASAIAIGPDGAIYVASWLTNRIHVFDPSSSSEVWSASIPGGQFPAGLAFAPHRIEGKLSGSFTSATVPMGKLAERVVVSVTPGSNTVMIDFPDAHKSTLGFDDRFAQEALVFHGYEASTVLPKAKKRAVVGVELGDVVSGSATLSALASGKFDATGAFRMKSIVGTVGRGGTGGGWHATLKAAKRLN
jgi:DNA-binding beta-propeller fold protein YncE